MLLSPAARLPLRTPKFYQKSLIRSISSKIGQLWEWLESESLCDQLPDLGVIKNAGEMFGAGPKGEERQPLCGVVAGCPSNGRVTLPVVAFDDSQ
jgi:hypothetical protein